MATVTKSIGTAGGRDYSTITAWEADLAGGSYSSGDAAVGECYDDSTFDESFNIDDTGLAHGLISITLKSHSSSLHDGTPDSGVKIKYTGTVSNEVGVYRVSYDQGTYGSNKVIIEDLEFAEATTTASVNMHLIDCDSQKLIMRRCLINRITHGGLGNKNLFIFGPDTTAPTLLNTMIFNCGKTTVGGSSNGRMTALYIAGSNSTISNCTIHNMYDNTGGVQAWGIFAGTARNCIVTNADVCFSASVNDAYNISSDSTADAATSLANREPLTLYVSTIQGSEDLHLKSGASALRRGSDLGTTNGVNLDINGYDRDSNNSHWDIGADQCHACQISQNGSNQRLSLGFMISHEIRRFNLTDF